MTRTFTVLAAALMAAFLMSTARAQQIPIVCQPHKKIADRLLQEYREIVVARGVAGTALFQVFASAAGSWTVVVTRPDMNNLACIQGTGTAFDLTGNKFPEPKSDPT